MDPTTVEETKERKIIKIDKGQVREHLGHSRAWKRLSVDLLDAEADRLYARASRYERSADRVDTRAGHYQRQLHTKAGEVLAV